MDTLDGVSGERTKSEKRTRRLRCIGISTLAMAMALGACDVTGGGDATERVAFVSAVQTGGTSGTADTTALALTFDADPASLSVDDIDIAGATKGALSGSGMTRSLGISGIAVANGETVTISISSPSDCAITGSPRSATVYRALTIGMEYLGGRIAYVLQSGDLGYDAAVPHGLVAALEDQGGGCMWAVGMYQAVAVGGTLTAVGTGAANTDVIIAEIGAGTGYAAGLARAYRGGGYADWYLPSKDELNKLYLNRAAIGGFSDSDDYWSSSEYDGMHACDQWFLDGTQYDDSLKTDADNVRAVRSF